MRWRSISAAAALTALAAAGFSGSAAGATGDITQLAGVAGCLSTNTRAAEAGPDGVCGRASALGGPGDVVVSSDGQNVYVGSHGTEADDEKLGGEGIAVLRRDPATGAVQPLAGSAGCVNGTGSDMLTGGACTRVPGFSTPSNIVLSGDGRQLYAISGIAVFVFARDTSTGALTPFPGRTGCLSPTGKAGKAKCAKAPIDGVAMVLSPDDTSLYVGGAGLGTLKRDPSTGRLRPLGGKAGCLSYRGKLPGRRGQVCGAARGLGEPTQELAVSQDGKYVYAGSYRNRPDNQFGGMGLAVFRRSAKTGALTQLTGKAGCRYDRGVRDKAFLAGCEVVDDMEFVGHITPLSDNRTVVVSAEAKLLRFARSSTGALLLRGSLGSSRGIPALMEEEGIWYFIYGATYGAASGFGVIEAYGGDPLTRLPAAGGCLTERLGDLSTAGEAKGAPLSPPCGLARALFGPTSAAVSPDHRNLYVASGGFEILHGALAVFALAP